MPGSSRSFGSSTNPATNGNLLVVEQEIDELRDLNVVDGDRGLILKCDDQVLLLDPVQFYAEQRDERAALHSITSSARASSVGGISRPSALAVVRLMIRSNLLGCSTGMSPGLAPRRILST